MRTIGKGSKHWRAKLSQSDVDAVRQLYHQHPNAPVDVVAEHYGVHRTTIQRIVRGRTWRK